MLLLGKYLVQWQWTEIDDRRRARCTCTIVLCDVRASGTVWASADRTSRGVSLKLGLQLISREYAYTKEQQQDIENQTQPAINGNGAAAQGGKKKRKGGKDVGSPARSETKALPTQTFHPDDIVMFVPVVKGAAPKVRA